MAERVGGVVLPTFFWGTERERPEEMVADLGFEKGQYVVGMDFPANILPSLYCREEFLALLVRELLTLLIRQQYKLIVLVNGHGARNHLDTSAAPGHRVLGERAGAGDPGHGLALQGRPRHLYRARRRRGDVGDDGPVPG